MTSRQPDLTIERLRADLGPWAEASRFGAAVSGGADSLALLLLTAAAFPGRVEAATVDHGLRPESAAEAEMVARICAGMSVPHEILKVNVPDGKAGLQGEARAARYAALSAWCERRRLKLLLTAHHADDQAETLLMRLQRGSGLSGLSGIRAARPLTDGVTIVRPLLGWTKAELARIVADAGMTPADDPSNRDPRFGRTAARALLAAHPEFDPRPFARAAAALAEADAALNWAADRLLDERLTEKNGALFLKAEDLPAELIRRLLLRLIARFAPEASPRGEEVERLAAVLAAGGAATLAGIKASGGPVWRFEPARPRRKP